MSGAENELRWTTGSGERHARHVSAREGRGPTRAVEADDRMTADAAFRLVSQGTGIVWAGDYHNARQLLQALGRRIDKRKSPKSVDNAATLFHAYRQEQAQRANMLALVLLPIENSRVPLPRAPDATTAITEAIGPLLGEWVLPLRDLLAFISAHEWRRNGVPITALGGERIHPHYGVFPPTRQDHIDLVARAPLTATDLAFDLGVGSGVLTAVLLHRGVRRVVATDIEPRALACAADNFARLGLADRVSPVAGKLFPDGRAPLIVCNPPWLPAKAGTAMEGAVYDPGSGMLRGFLDGLTEHLTPGGEGWLVMSDLAEHLGLRSREDLTGWIEAAGLKVLRKLEAPPSPKGARDAADPLYFARSKETVFLWCLGPSR